MERGPYNPWHDPRHVYPVERDRAALHRIVRQARINANLRQSDLAPKLGIGRSMLAMIEAGEKPLPYDRWPAFTAALPELQSLDVVGRRGGRGARKLYADLRARQTDLEEFTR